MRPAVKGSDVNSFPVSDPSFKVVYNDRKVVHVSLFHAGSIHILMSMSVTWIRWELWIKVQIKYKLVYGHPSITQFKLIKINNIENTKKWILVCVCGCELIRPGLRDCYVQSKREFFKKKERLLALRQKSSRLWENFT